MASKYLEYTHWLLPHLGIRSPSLISACAAYRYETSHCTLSFAHGKSIIDRVQNQRLLMAIAAIPLLAAYAAFARIPANLRLFLFLLTKLAMTCLLYSMSLDWVAWGKERLQLQTLTRALVPCSILLFLIVGHVRHGQVLWWAVIGNTVGYVFQILILWRWWRNTERRESNEEGAQARERCDFSSCTSGAHGLWGLHGLRRWHLTP